MIPELNQGCDFAGLTAYLVVNRNHTVIDLRGVSSIDAAADEMRSVAVQSHRVRNPVLHVSFSAAREDGRVEAHLWLSLVDAAERELRLNGHQRVVVRHHDKDHDHVHVLWCTVHEGTGRTPPRQWFRKLGAPCPELDQRALDDEQRARVGGTWVVQGSFSRLALARLMMVCRAFEATHGLRRLRGREEMAAARQKGESRPERPFDGHREQRTGRRSLAASACVIREALDRPSWAEARQALNIAGMDMAPVIRGREGGGEEYRGLLVVDLGDHGNRIPASFFDLPDRRYGLRQIEGRRESGVPTIEAWWPTCSDAASIPPGGDRSVSRLRMEYDRLLADHRRTEAERADARRRLASKHADERRRRRRKLMALRRLRAARLTACERRDFYVEFSRRTRMLIWNALKRRQATARAVFRPRPMPTWDEFLRRGGRNLPIRIDEVPSSSVTAVRQRDLGRSVERDVQIGPPSSTPGQAVDETGGIDLQVFAAWRDARSR